MADTIEALAGTPIPTILVVAGIVFLILSVAGRLSGHLTIPESRKRQALFTGLVLLAVGVFLNLPQNAPVTQPSPAPSTPAPVVAEQEPTAAPQQTTTAPAPASSEPEVALARPSPLPGVTDIVWDDYDWKDLKQEYQALWAKLGYTAAKWDGGIEPSSYKKDFGELSAAEQEAVWKLGYTPEAWDEEK
ncbi:MAG: hypothetical protein AAF409_08530 [Pseudomonadota bacterium]